MRLFRMFFGFSRVDQLRLVRAAFLILFIRLGLQLMPFRTLRRLLSKMGRVRQDALPPDEVSIRQVVWAVSAAGRRMPWASTCLTRALAAQVMLGRLGEPTALSIGVAKDEQDKFKAHAWLESRGEVVIGGEESLTEFTKLPDLERKIS